MQLFNRFTSCRDIITGSHHRTRKSPRPFNGFNEFLTLADPGPVTNAWIHHCDIDTGDDDIVIKSGAALGTFFIDTCTIAHGQWH